MAEQNSPTEAKTKPKTIRLIRPSVVVLCGPAACGKSTFAARYFRPTQIISSDQARALVCDDEGDQRFQTQAFSLVHSLIDLRLGINRLCVVDSTALTPQARASLLEIARKHQVPCAAIVFDVPLEKCLERDASRERTVGRVTIERHYQLFGQARAAIRQEGFTEVVELRDEDLAAVDLEIRFRPVQTPADPNRPQWRPGPTRPGQPESFGKMTSAEVKRDNAPRVRVSYGGAQSRTAMSEAVSKPAQSGSAPGAAEAHAAGASRPATQVTPTEAPAATPDLSAKAPSTACLETPHHGENHKGT